MRFCEMYFDKNLNPQRSNFRNWPVSITKQTRNKFFFFLVKVEKILLRKELKGTVSRHGFPIFWKQFTDRVNIEDGVFLTFLEASPFAVLNNKKQENFYDNFKKCRCPFIGLAKRSNLSRGTVPLREGVYRKPIMVEFISLS